MFRLGDNTLNVKGGTQHPVSANVRRFQSNQGISDINNIHMDLLIQSFDRRNANIVENSDVVNLY